MTGDRPDDDEPAPRPRQLWLVRHGETEWARTGRHTGRTDVPLTEIGRAQARALGDRLSGHAFAEILSSPLLRARDTAAIAVPTADVVADPDLQEWDYGDLEGLTTAEIRQRHPDWAIWRGPWPGGETIDEVGARADRVLARIDKVDGDVLVFAHGHLLRILAARWLDLPPTSGGMFALGTATISILGWDRAERVVETWNVTCDRPVGTTEEPESRVRLHFGDGQV